MRLSLKAIFIIATFIVTEMALKAQVIKDITVSQEESFTDHIALGHDSRDTDIIVKIQFGESANSLKVSIISYRSLFVFRERTRYGAVTNHFGRVLPDQFPYVVSSDPTAKFKFSKQLKKSIKGRRKNYIFNKWIEYSGLQPQPAEYAMVNDFIEQSFDITGKRDLVSVTLRDIYLLEGGEILCGKDLNTRYNVKIKRNPCFGKEEEIASAATTLESLIQNYNTLKESSSGGVAESQETADIFLQLQNAVKAQFPRKETKSDCPEIQSTWDAYNSIVDSIAALKCVYEIKITGINPQIIIDNTQSIDDHVSGWLTSKDPVEKRDLKEATEELINDTEKLVKLYGLANSEQIQAYEMFKKAVKYYRGIIK